MHDLSGRCVRVYLHADELTPDAVTVPPYHASGFRDRASAVPWGVSRCGISLLGVLNAAVSHTHRQVLWIRVRGVYAM